MKKTALLLSLLSASILLKGQDTTRKATKYAETIQADDLKKHLTIIASDSLEGRDTGSEGGKKAAIYIAKQFEKLGLQPIVPMKEGDKSYFQSFNILNKNGETYLQPFNLYKKNWKEVYVKIKNKKKKVFQDFYPTNIINIPDEQTMQVVYIGYGIESEKYSDYSAVDIKNKAVIFFEGEPKDSNGNYIITKTGNNSEWIEGGGLYKKIEIARKKGANFFFVIANNDAKIFKETASKNKEITENLSRMNMAAQPAEQTSPYAAFTVSQEMGAEIVGISTKKLAKLKTEIAIKKVSNSAKIKVTNVAIKSERFDDLIKTQNVLGFLEGTDKKDEVIILTAHYDHLGKKNGQIYNGADDDGSGTCAILELAEAYTKAKADGNAPRRSILFMTVTGEEKGLYGSQYYTDVNPIVPLEKIVCDLNIDMIGRIDVQHAPKENYVYLIGSDKLSSELHHISQETNMNSINYQLDYTYNNPQDPNRFYYRSDHYNFAKHKIPVIFYFTGVHEDYHQPTDDVDKIMFPKYQQIVRLVFLTSWNIANRDERLKVDSNKP